MAFTRPFIGDTGAGGVEGLVPAPAAGDAAAGKFLKADGTWQTPAGGGGGGHTIQDNGVNMTARAKLNFLNFNLADNAGNDSTDVEFVESVTSVNGATGIILLDTDDIDEGVGNLYYTDARVRLNRLDQMAAPTASVSMNSQKITNLADPVSGGDGVNKSYADALIQGLQLKPSAQYATTEALPAYTYNNGASGAGATITLNAAGVLTIDDNAVVLNDYVLIKDEAGGNAPYNGLYKCTTEGNVGTAAVLTRAVEMNTTTEFRGAFVFIEDGTVNAYTGWICTNVGNITVGTTNVSFTQFSEAGAYIDGAGLTLTGRTFSVNVDDSTIEINADTLRIKDQGVTYAKIQNVSATDKLLGRSTAGAGVIEEITCTSFARSFLDDTDAATARSTLGLGNVDNVQQMPLSYLDTDGTLAANSDVKVASQKATKTYVDSVAQGLSIKNSCRFATSAALDANTYLAGVITADANGPLSIGGSSPDNGDRVLVKNESTQANNGIYVVTDKGSAGTPFVLTRASDMNANGEIAGAFTFVEEGLNSGNGYVVAGAGPYTIGTTPIVFTQFSGAGQITAGVALAKTGNTLDLDITELAEDTSPDASNDFLVTYDASAGEHKKVKPTNLPIRAASDTQAGMVELATAAETTTGTDAARAVTPDGLAGSSYGIRLIPFVLPYGLGGVLTTGDGQAGFPVPSELNGWNVVGWHVQVGTAGTTGTSDFQLRRVRSGSPVDVFSTKPTIDSGEISATSGAAQGVINTSNDDLATDDWLYVDVDATSTTPPTGPIIFIAKVQLP